MEQDIFLTSPERQNQILHLLARQPRITVTEICTQFGVSEATARRDLESLASQDKLQRVHGGAISVLHAPPEPPMIQRQIEQAGEKIRIGYTAASLVQDGETVFLGSGTTVLEVARQLWNNRTQWTPRGLTVITNSLPVINILAGVTEITLISLGGMLRQSELSFIGHITEQALAEVRADKVILGIHALSLEHGLTNDYLPETMTDRAILRAGRQVILLVDHTKIGRVSTALLAPIDSVNTIVTDPQAPKEFIAAAESRGIHVIIA
jgi:DeoR family transcriptional regulator, aga operon transcriptional repressor